MRGRDVVLVAGVVVLALLLLGLFGSGMTGYGRTGPWGGWMGPGMMGGYGFGWGGLMLAFWALAIGGVVLLVLHLLGPNPTTTTLGQQDAGGRALDVLRERYARGEITREQYDQMRRDLGGG